MKVMIGDGKIRRVWEVVRGLGGDEGASVWAEDGSQVVVEGEDEQRVSDRTGVESSTAYVGRWLGLSAYAKAASPAVDGSDERIVPTDFERPPGDKSNKHMRSAHTGADQIDDQNNSTGTKDDRNHKRPLDLTLDTRQRSRDFLTPLNWALQIWLKREKGNQDHEYVRIVEGRGVGDVISAEKMKDALLEEFSKIPQSGEFRAGV